MSRKTGLSRQAIYSILNRKHVTKPENVKKFNDYLRELMEQRMKLSRMLSA